MLTHGMATCVFKRAMDWGTRFMIINALRARLLAAKVGRPLCSSPTAISTATTTTTTVTTTAPQSANEGLSDAEKLCSSFVGGAASVTVTMPLDRLMPVLRASGASQRPVLAVLRECFGAEGLATLQRGWIMRTLHTGYHTMFAIFVADKIYAALG